MFERERSPAGIGNLVTGLALAAGPEAVEKIRPKVEPMLSAAGVKVIPQTQKRIGNAHGRNKDLPEVPIARRLGDQIKNGTDAMSTELG